jgi:hypothetical protein
MKEGWVKIFSGIELLEVKLAEDVLKQNNIESHIAQKGDSVFQATAEAALYTLPEKAEAAIKILKENNFK